MAWVSRFNVISEVATDEDRRLRTGRSDAVGEVAMTKDGVVTNEDGADRTGVGLCGPRRCRVDLTALGKLARWETGLSWMEKLSSPEQVKLAGGATRC
jgi:hypothetical protein